jgi:glycosyltransferase involved in cell wall biosynthesis
MLPVGWGRYLYRPLHRIAARRASHIVTDSEGARDAILHQLSVPVAKVSVVHPAPDPFFSPDQAVQRGPYFFSVISNKPHKNGKRLVQAFAMSRPEKHGFRLLIAGPDDSDWPSWEQLVAEAGIADWVTILGRIPDELLRDYYRRCGAFVFPSFIEGFGFPILEAMACGAPLVVADASPMRDLAGDVALRFAPFDERALAEVLLRLIAEPALRESLSYGARKRSAEFTWERCARQTLAVCEAVTSRQVV